MAILKAKNNQRSIEHFINRSYYKNVYYPTSIQNSIDFWTNSLLYGRIDTNLNSVMLNPEQLKYLKQNTISQFGTHYTLNFVADSYAEFLSEVQKADFIKLIPKSKLNPITVTKSTIIPQTSYETDLIKLMESVFTSDTLRNKILTFKDFLNDFIYYVSNTSLKVTQTSYMLGELSSPLHTGLVIELSNLKHDEDQPKAISYIQDTNYQFFFNTAEKYSFYVDKNAPWRMVFNVSTNYALEKMKNYGINSLEEMFKVSYTPTYLSDWKILRTSLVNFYNQKALTKQTVQIPVICNGNLLFETKSKASASEQDYSDLIWIKLYYFVRLKEQRTSLTQVEFESRCSIVSNLYNTGGELAALDYINNQTKLFVDGGTNPGYRQYVQIESNKRLNNSSFVFKF